MSEGVVLDANVLHPIALCDLLLRLALEGLYRPLWSAEILEETKRSILRRRPDLERRALGARIAAMQRALPEALVTGYETRLAEFAALGTDAHVLAAAAHAGAHVIVTDNVRDFPAAALRPHGIKAQTADQFLVRHWQTEREVVARVLSEQAAGTRRPPLSVRDVLAGLERMVPRFVALARASRIT